MVDVDDVLGAEMAEALATRGHNVSVTDVNGVKAVVNAIVRDGDRIFGASSAETYSEDERLMMAVGSCKRFAEERDRCGVVKGLAFCYRSDLQLYRIGRQTSQIGGHSIGDDAQMIQNRMQFIRCARGLCCRLNLMNKLYQPDY